MHERIDAQIGHGEGHQNRPDKGASPDQSPESGPLVRVKPLESTVKILPVLTHFTPRLSNYSEMIQYRPGQNPIPYYRWYRIQPISSSARLMLAIAL